ncbi:MAG TPA: dTDP-4-dehydrorhamnose reductase [Gammaproteobacteria bacterium]|nr:dTDP-4-dehydrorhamnose reductase [Gammaproteobacteria bacterium]
MQRIVLTGTNGQLGHEMMGRLSELGELHAFDRSTLDLTNTEQIRDIMRTLNPHIIVNAAAYTAVDRAEEEPEKARLVNAQAPRILAEEAKRCDALLVHYSTDYVFDGQGNKPWTEDQPTAPLSVYGETKRAGELAIAEVGCAHLIFRTSWVYGLHGANFVKTMLKLARERPQLSIIDDQIGAPTSAQVISDISVKILRQGQHAFYKHFLEYSGIYNLVCNGETSWYGFAQQIFSEARKCGEKLALQDVHAIPGSQYPTLATRPMNSRLNTDKIRAAFDIKLPDWESSLARCFPGILDK